ncbi:hypothetical protein [Candidatus Methylocalor cossyra]|uniref:Uncharacterized protein n=1 Tax=Candidatus Methylocalor cossyra TaxID=3108543 RepID=A0ABP1C5R3_9GAMM
MQTITVRTAGATIKGRRFNAGTYTPPLYAEFDRPGYYWLEPVADDHGTRWVEKAIRLGACDTREQLERAINMALQQQGILDDAIWLLGATTAMSLFVEKRGRR